MWESIISTGGIFFLILLVLLYHFEHTEITCLIPIGNVPIGANTGLTPYELSPIIIASTSLVLWSGELLHLFKK